MRAEEELKEVGINMDPDRYYTLMLEITGSEKKARSKQAELMFKQMELQPLSSINVPTTN